MKMLTEEKLRDLLTRAWAGGYAHAAEQTLKISNGKKPPAKAAVELERMVGLLMDEAHP